MKRARWLRKMSEKGPYKEVMENEIRGIKNDNKVCKCKNCVCNKNKMKK